MYLNQITTTLPFVTTAQVAAYCELDINDPLIPLFISQACDDITQYLRFDLLTTQRIVKYELQSQYPFGSNGFVADGEYYSGSFAGDFDIFKFYKNDHKLPYAVNNVVINTITSNNVAIDPTEYELVDGFPAYIATQKMKPINITYTSGWSSASSVPAGIVIATLQYILYLYDHRGQCELDDVGTVCPSLQQYRVLI